MAKGDTIDNAEVGDSVRFKTKHGEYSGVVKMRFQNHVVVGGRRFPCGKVVDSENFVSMKRMPGRKEMVRWL